MCFPCSGATHGTFRRRPKIPQPRLIVSVSGGVVQEIVTDQPVEIILVDRDNIQQGDRPQVFPTTIDPAWVQAHWNQLLAGHLPNDRR
jgi:hypothetical protein